MPEAVVTRVVLNAGAEFDGDAVMRDRLEAAESAAGWIVGSVLAPEDDRHARGDSDRRGVAADFRALDARS